MADEQLGTKYTTNNTGGVVVFGLLFQRTYLINSSLLCTSILPPSLPQSGLACKALIIFPVTTTYSSFLPTSTSPPALRTDISDLATDFGGSLTHRAYGAYSSSVLLVSPVQTIKQWSVRWSSFCSLLFAPPAVSLAALKPSPHRPFVPTPRQGWLAGLDWMDWTGLDRTEWDVDRVSYFHYPPHFQSGSSISPFSTSLSLLLLLPLHSLPIPANVLGSRPLHGLL